MRIIRESRIKEFWRKYSDAEASLIIWTKYVKSQNWNNPAELSNTALFSPDPVKNFVIFNIGGNKYRLITYIDYTNKVIFIRDFLTHTEYDRNKWKDDSWFNT